MAIVYAALFQAVSTCQEKRLREKEQLARRIQEMEALQLPCSCPERTGKLEQPTEISGPSEQYL